jgi:hypothetical protein
MVQHADSERAFRTVGPAVGVRQLLSSGRSTQISTGERRNGALRILGTPHRVTEQPLLSSASDIE